MYKILLISTVETPKEILQKYSDKLVMAVGANVTNVTNALYSQDLIPSATREYVVTTVGVPASAKANTLMVDVSGQLEAALDPKAYLEKVCNVLTQQSGATKEIGKLMLKELGMSYNPCINAHFNNRRRYCSSCWC